MSKYNQPKKGDIMNKKSEFLIFWQICILILTIVSVIYIFTLPIVVLPLFLALDGVALLIVISVIIWQWIQLNIDLKKSNNPEI